MLCFIALCTVWKLIHTWKQKRVNNSSNSYKNKSEIKFSGYSHNSYFMPELNCYLNIQNLKFTFPFLIFKRASFYFTVLPLSIINSNITPWLWTVAFRISTIILLWRRKNIIIQIRNFAPFYTALAWNSYVHSSSVTLPISMKALLI